jgi:hypothetical protein
MEVMLGIEKLFSMWDSAEMYLIIFTTTLKTPKSGSK